MVCYMNLETRFQHNVIYKPGCWRQSQLRLRFWLREAILLPGWLRLRLQLRVKFGHWLRRRPLLHGFLTSVLGFSFVRFPNLQTCCKEACRLRTGSLPLPGTSMQAYLLFLTRRQKFRYNFISTLSGFGFGAISLAWPISCYKQLCLFRGRG